MNFKPSDFYLGVVELFGVLLPGVLLTALLHQPLSDDVFKALPPPKGAAATLATYLIAGYVLGNALRAAGQLLDIGLYGLWVKFRGGQEDGRALLACAEQLMEKHITGLERKRSGTYKWAVSYLAIVNPTALASVSQATAESKFFRSLTIVIVVACFLHGSGWTVVICVVAALSSLFAYLEAKWDATTVLYRAYILVRLDAPASANRAMG